MCWSHLFEGFCSCEDLLGPSLALTQKARVIGAPCGVQHAPVPRPRLPAIDASNAVAQRVVRAIQGCFVTVVDNFRGHSTPLCHSQRAFQQWLRSYALLLAERS